MGGLDYRASPDWASKLGISDDGLAEFQLRSIEFLRDVARPFEGQIPQILIAGMVGPRGDAYGQNRTITAEEAEEYHGVQIETLRGAEVDLVSAMTFNSVPEAVGVARAAAKAGLPLSLSFMVDPSGRLPTGPSLKEAVETVDEQAGEARPDYLRHQLRAPVEFEPALVEGPWLERLRALRPNASMKDKQALCTIGHLEAGDPELLGAEMGGLARRLPPDRRPGRLLRDLGRPPGRDGARAPPDRERLSLSGPVRRLRNAFRNEPSPLPPRPRGPLAEPSSRAGRAAAGRRG